MNALRFLVYSMLICFCSCQERVKKVKQGKELDVLHYVERYCFQDLCCTNTVYKSGDNLNVSDYYLDNCVLKELNFIFIEDTVYIKPISFDSSFNTIRLDGYIELFFLLGNSVIYQDFFEECLKLYNIFVKGVEKDLVEGYINICGEPHWVSVNLEYDNSDCLDFEQLKMNVKKIEKNTYLFEFTESEFHLTYIIKNLDISNLNEYFFSRLIELKMQ